MDDNNNSELFSFDSPLNQPSYIKVIGVGGGGIDFFLLTLM